jgi:hypothetical protein
MGLRWQAALLPAALLVLGGRAGSRLGRVMSHSVGGDILPLGMFYVN